MRREARLATRPHNRETRASHACPVVLRPVAVLRFFAWGQRASASWSKRRRARGAAECPARAALRRPACKRGQSVDGGGNGRRDRRVQSWPACTCAPPSLGSCTVTTVR